MCRSMLKIELTPLLTHFPEPFEGLEQNRSTCVGVCFFPDERPEGSPDQAHHNGPIILRGV